MPTLHTILLVAPILLFSMVAHEIAHGYVALRQGDRTALDAGRLSWNPARHIDPVLTILLPLIMLWGSSALGKGGFVIGGAKPVPVNRANLRHPRWSDILVSLAGVAANLLVGLACVLVVALIGAIGRQAAEPSRSLGILQAMFFYGILMNAGLIAFNLLPIPPLDGSHVLRNLLPKRLAEAYVRVAPIGIVILLVSMALWPRGLALWMGPAQRVAGDSIVALVRHGLMLPTAVPWLPWLS